MLDTLDIAWGEPPEGSARYDAPFSLVIDDRASGIRRLPTFFFGNAQMFADRDLEAVTSKLTSLIPRVARAYERPFYFFNACKLEGKCGLYARDFFNRAIYRRRLERLGMVFSDDPLAEFSTTGLFSNEQWEPFRPAFLILGLSRRQDPPPILRLEGASLLYTMTTFRLGSLSRAEFHALGALVAELVAVNSEDPATLVEALRAG